MAQRAYDAAKHKEALAAAELVGYVGNMLKRGAIESEGAAYDLKQIIDAYHSAGRLMVEVRDGSKVAA